MTNPDKIEIREGGRRIRGLVRPEPPLVSIITVLFRARAECLRLLENILSFDHNDFELIVIDGGSDDGTVDILEQWDDEIDYWLSEPDSGIYDAMNKGIAASQGRYILHINAGDTLKALPREALAMCLEEGVDVASFCVTMDRNEIYIPQTGFSTKVANTWHHQGTFYRRTPDLIYDTSYRIFADFDLNQRWLKRGKKIRIFEKIIVSHHLRNGISQNNRDDQEKLRIVRKNFGLTYVIAEFFWTRYYAFRRGTKRVLVYLLSLIGKSWPERR